MFQPHSFLILLLALSLVCPAIGVGQERIAVEASYEVEAMPGHSSDRGPIKHRIVEARPMHSHFLDPETLVEWKEQALWGEHAPSATALEGRPPLKSGPAPSAPSAVTAFDGLNRRDTSYRGFIFLPPDTVVAASPGRILEGANTAFRLSNRTGTGAEVRSMYSLFNHDLPVSLFDPKVYYDRLSNRFYAVALYLDRNREKSFIYLAVSRSPNPRTLNVPSDWCTYRLQGRVGASWADYPGLGMNENYIAITTNNFNFAGGFRSVYLNVLDKRVLAENAAECPAQQVWRYKLGNDAFGLISFTVQPAVHYSTNSDPGTPLYLVSSQPLAISEKYTFWSLFDEPGSDEPAVSRSEVVTDFDYSLPPEAPQNGGSDMDTGDIRLQQVVYRDGRVWAVQSTSCNFGAPPNESCVRVFALEPDGDGGAEIVYDEIFGGGEGWYYWMPGIAINGDGTVLVAYQRSRAEMSIGMGFATLAPGETTFTMGKLINGRCALDNFGGGSSNRTGDYIGVQTDPADDHSFWIAGEYSGGVGGLGCDWRTRIARIVP